MKLFYKTILILSIIGGFILPSFTVLAQEPLSPPKTMNDAKETGIKVVKKSVEELPAKLKEIWKLKVIPLWQGMWNGAKGAWNSYFKVKFENLWTKIKNVFQKEAEKRKPIIKEEFEKEKQEMKQEIKKEIKKEASKTGQSIWQRFKDLLK